MSKDSEYHLGDYVDLALIDDDWIEDDLSDDEMITSKAAMVVLHENAANLTNSIHRFPIGKHGNQRYEKWADLRLENFVAESLSMSEN